MVMQSSLADKSSEARPIGVGDPTGWGSSVRLEAGALGQHEVVLGVAAVGLNFRDVLNVLGMYPGDPGDPGGDCAGTIAAVGPASTHRRAFAITAPECGQCSRSCTCAGLREIKHEVCIVS